MSALLALLPDLLPMMLPSAVHVTKAADLEATHRRRADAAAIREQGAIVGKTEKMCATILRAPPHSASAVHHHGEQDTIIYAAAGRGVLLVNAGDASSSSSPSSSSSFSSDGSMIQRHELSPGDFAFVPPWTEHQARNEAGDEDLVWVLIRSGPEPEVVCLTGWGGRVTRPST